MIKYKLKTAPTIYPVSLAQLKDNLHIEQSDTDQDTYLQDLIYRAIEWAESFTGRQFCRATWIAYLQAWPDEDLLIDKGPVAAISTVKYYAAGANTTTTMSSSLYQLDNSELDAVLRINDNPNINDDRLNPIEIEFTNGWATAGEVPKNIVDAIILAASERYLNPENQTLNFGMGSKFTAAERLLRNYRIQRY